MPFKHGKFTQVYIDDRELTGYFSDANVSGTAEAAETTVFGTGAKQYVLGLQDAKVSLSGLFDGTVGAVDEKLAADMGQEANVIATVIPGGSSRGFTLNTKETSYEVTSPVNDVVKVAAELQADGKVGRGPVLMASQVISTTPVNGTSVDDTASSANGCFANCHVTSNTRNGTVTVKVQHSADNSTWADLTPSFATFSATTNGSARIDVTGTVNRYLRAVVTLAGTTGSATVTVVLARN